MISSYIAAWTAFSAVTLPIYFGNSFVFWLWPTAVGVPAIVLTTIYYSGSLHRYITWLRGVRSTARS